MADDSAKEDCTIAICPSCSQIVFVTVSSVTDKETLKELAACVKDGYNIEHMTVGEFRGTKHFGKCKCGNCDRG